MYGDQMGEFVCRYKGLKGYSLALMYVVRYKMPHYDIVFLH